MPAFPLQLVIVLLATRGVSDIHTVPVALSTSFYAAFASVWPPSSPVPMNACLRSPRRCEFGLPRCGNLQPVKLGLHPLVAEGKRGRGSKFYKLEVGADTTANHATATMNSGFAFPWRWLSRPLKVSLRCCFTSSPLARPPERKWRLALQSPLVHRRSRKKVHLEPDSDS